ncbi:MAG: BTAD domain-containing putative transcriptional regulator [Coprobacillus sp.]
MEKVIKVAMFQSFSMEYEGTLIYGDDIKSDKLIKLLSYLVYYYDRPVPSNELIDLIWYYEDIDNPIGALKNLVYRLRTIIKKSLGLEDFITTGKSCYSINEDYTIVIDAHQFEQCNKLIIEKKDNYIKAYEDMMQLYKGRFLPEIDEDHRALSRSAYFHSLYISRVVEYAEILEADQNFETMETIARKTISIDNLDENIYIILIKALYYQGFYQQALDTYKETTDLLYRFLGTNPSQEMKELYELIKKEKHIENTDIGDIQKSLLGKEKHGAFLCEYGAFRDLYNLEARMMNRLGVCTHLCVVTISDQSRYEVDKEKNSQYVEKTMQKIQASLVDGLRVGDVISRFSVNQFVIMLPVCNYENSALVMDRILKKIKRSLNNKNITMSISIKEVESTNLIGA